MEQESSTSHGNRDSSIEQESSADSELAPSVSMRPFADRKNDSHETRDLEKGPASHTSSVEGSTDLGQSNEKDLSLEVTDPDMVDWDGPDDPSNPVNWAPKKKWTNVAVLSAITFVTPLGSTIFAPGVPNVMNEFGSNNTLLASFVVSVYVLGFVFGPFVAAPASELYGRVPISHISNVFYLILTIACAVSSNLPMFIVFRLLQGIAGASPVTIGGGIIADMFKQEERGGAMTIWVLGPLVGPVIGPIIGGYTAESLGWRWIFWILAILIGIATTFCFVFMRETYPVTLLTRKTKRLRKETGNQNLYSHLDLKLSPEELFRRAIVRPTKLLVLSPIVFLLSLHTAIVYGYMYLLFTTFTYVFEDIYGFTSGESGLVYLGLGIGSIFGLFFTGFTSDRILKAKSKDGNMKPEYRLPPLAVGAFAIPIGLFWYSWSAYERTHWIVPILGSGLVGIGVLTTFMPIMTYLVDAFPLYAAAAGAANTILRSLFGAVLPLAGQPLFDNLGLNWGGSLLGFIAIAFIPIPFVFIFYGERIRTSKRFQIEL